MKRQKSFQNDRPTLYLVATPIGNLEEMSSRAIDILKNVNVIAAEDTRNTQKLCGVFDIHTKLITHHLHNEKDSSQGIIRLLESGQNVALVSDAGVPLLSDPGAFVVESVIHAGYNVVPIGVNNAAIAALIASGLSPQPHLFYGFLPLQDKAFKQELTQLKAYPMTLIFYEAPHRLKKTLEKMIPILGDRKAVIARELTKLHEEFLRGHLSELIEEAEGLKGEMVLVVEGQEGDREKPVDLSEINAMIQNIMENGYSASEAIKEVAKQTGLAKNEIYDHFHRKEPS